MTWLVGTTCFNGFVCAADIQATFTYPNGDRKYLNCIQKVHKVYDNLIVGFSGDIRLGLLIIDELRQFLEEHLRPTGHVFDLDGETHVMEHNLNVWHQKYHTSTSSCVEFMFCWFAQDDDEIPYHSYVCMFSPPNFKRSGTGMFQKTLQSGSGKNERTYQEVIHFLSGQANVMNNFYREIYGTSGEDKIVFTVRRFRRLLANEVKKSSVLGVSKSLLSFEATIHYDKLHTPKTNSDLHRIAKKLGLIQETSYALEKPTTYVSFNPVLYQERILKLFESNPSEALEIMASLQNMKKNTSWNALAKPPLLEEFYDKDEIENIDKKDIVDSWDGFKGLVTSKGIRLNACSATA